MFVYIKNKKIIFMKQIIKDTIENYFIDENTFQVYRKSNRTNKMLKVNWKADKEGMSVTLALFFR